MAALAARSRAVRAYHADVTMHVHMHSFPYVRITFRGKTEYTYPGHFSAAFRAPRKLVDGYEKAFNDVGDPSTWAQRHTIELDQGSPPSDRDVVVLRLTPVNDPSVDHTLAYVNTKSLTVQEYVWCYRNGGRIDMKQRFARVQGVAMATRQDIDVNLASVKVSLEADVSNYVLELGEETVVPPVGFEPTLKRF